MLSDFIKNQGTKLPTVERPTVTPRGNKLEPGGKRLNEYFKEQAKAKVTIGLASGTENSRLTTATATVSKLIVNRIFADRKIPVTLYDGKATELVQNYERYLELEKKRDAETERIRGEIEQKRTSLPLILKDHRQRAKEEMDKSVYEAKSALEGIKNNIQSSINIKREQLEREIKETLANYEADYKEVLDGALETYKEVQDIIKELRIANKRIEIPDFKEEPDIDDLLELARNDRELIQQLRNVDINTKQFSILAKEREDHIKESLVLATSTAFTPLSVGFALFGAGRKILDIGLNKKLIVQLQDEILMFYKIIRDQIQDFKDSYCKPSTKKLEDQLKEVEKTVNYNYEEDLTNAELNLRKAIKDRDERESNLNRVLAEEEEKLMAEIKAIEEAGTATIEGLNESVNTFRTTWREQRQEFIDSQVLPDFSKDIVTELSSELTPGMFLKPRRETTIDRYRLYANYEVLSGLELNTEPLGDSDEEIARCEYDKGIIKERDKVEKRIKEMEEEGITKELLSKQLEEYRRGLDLYFSPKYRGLVGGVHLMPENVRAAVDGADEYFKCDFDNKTLLFLYDDEHDGEEELLAN